MKEVLKENVINSEGVSQTVETVDPIRKIAEMLVEGSVWLAWAQVADKHGMAKAVEALPKVRTVVKALTTEVSQ